jgi:hypothetical protein
LPKRLAVAPKGVHALRVCKTAAWDGVARHCKNRQGRIMHALRLFGAVLRKPDGGRAHSGAAAETRDFISGASGKKCDAVHKAGAVQARATL